MNNTKYKGMSKTANFFFLIAVFIIIGMAVRQSKYLRSRITQILPNAKRQGVNKPDYIFKSVREMVYVPAGEFLMGGMKNTNEKPVHKVSLNGFWIDKYEVTNKDFEQFKPEHKKYRKKTSNENDQPVIHITWLEAQEYCKWRCDKEKIPRGSYRLPTEAEWEYAARGGLKQKEYPWGKFSPNAFDFLMANYNSKEKITAYCSKVGSFPPNGFGIYDMAGNVREWCFDWYDIYPTNCSNKTTYNPEGPTKSTKKVWRGGSWGSSQKDLRCASRGGISPNHWLDNLGFRCVRVK